MLRSISSQTLVQLATWVILGAFPSAWGRHVSAQQDGKPDDTPPASSPTAASKEVLGYIRVIQGLQKEIRDVSLVFEGVSEFVGPAELLKDVDGGAEAWKTRFQGNFLFRDDGATFVENYSRRNTTDLNLIHIVECLFKGRFERIEHHPNIKLTQAPIYSVSGVSNEDAAVMNRPESPFRFITLWFFPALSDAKAAQFEALGWEEVGGARCLKLKQTTYPADPASRTETYWIDLERGGHPLKIEWHDGPNLFLRTHDIHLNSFPSPDGKPIWLPVSGTTETFFWEDKFYEKPISRETVTVATSSVRLNQGLPDRYFTVKNGGAIPGGDAPNPLRQAFDDEAANPSKPRLRTDRASVQERLDRGLAEADRQARMIEASSSARQTWSLASTLQVLFVALGLGGIIFGGLALRRRG